MAESAFRLTVACIALLVAGCTTLTLAEEEALGRDLEKEARRELPFLRDRVVNGYIRDIGEDLLAAAGPQPFEYRFYVIEDEDINAFAMPAGGIYIHTETILASRNVSELAGVMAHEIGHIVHRHTAENYNRARTTGWVHQAAVLGAGIAGGGAAAGAANLLGGVSAMAYINSFGRDAERESDAFAADLLPRAGIHPEGTWSFFQTLKAEGGGQVPTFLSSHPATDERLEEGRARIDAAELPPGLRMDDGGKLEIIQRRIELLTGHGRSGPSQTQPRRR